MKLMKIKAARHVAENWSTLTPAHMRYYELVGDLEKGDTDAVKYLKYVDVEEMTSNEAIELRHYTSALCPEARTLTLRSLMNQ